MTTTSTNPGSIADQREWVLANLEPGVAAPMYLDNPGDLDTPASTYLKLRQASPAFLLESVERGESGGRYSFVGAAPRLVARLHSGTATVRAASG